MFRDRLTKERQKLWLVSGLSAAERPVFTQPEAGQGNSDGGTGEHDRRGLELSERWPRSYDVLTIARASSGI
jgi:hypothetical protein